jgi:hypothetical protein
VRRRTTGLVFESSLQMNTRREGIITYLHTAAAAKPDTTGLWCDRFDCLT